MIMATEDAAGRLTIGIWYRTLRWAVDELAKKLTPEQLGMLDVRAGEHLAAVLTTAFLLTAPTTVDDTGGVDLWFDLPDGREPGNLEILPARATSAAFEVKSLPGGFRKFDALIDRDRARGVDPTGRAVNGRALAAKDVLHDARPWLLRARDQLHRKVSGDGTSMNVFVVTHPLDHLTVESLRDYVMGPYLEPLEDVGDLDTVWVLWPPHHLTMWSRERYEWINLMFDLMNPDEKPGEFPALQAAEMYFFTRSGHTGGSPYLFTASYGETNPKSS
jgi:hypothetical protein